MAINNLPHTPNARPPQNRSQAYAGKPTADVLAHWARKFQPLPAPLGEAPFRYNLETAVPGIGESAAAAGKIVFHTVGDTGPIIDDSYLANVVNLMQHDLQKPPGEKPAFFYHLGDVVYTHGQYEEYYEQFYKAYHPYKAPIFSIPGNHDADPLGNQQALDGWMAFFMTKTPHLDPMAGDAPRLTMSLPNVYYTLQCPFVTIIGLYTNVPEHGLLGLAQQEWLANELRDAPMDKAMIVCLHNPIYSFDDQHGGSPLMGEALEAAINTSRRVPNLVLSAHVHNYQRIEKNIIPNQPTPFLVAGNGGYYILHEIIAENGAVDPETGARLVKGQDERHGYLQLTVDTNHIYGHTLIIDNITGDADIFDTFKYSAAPFLLEEGMMVKL